VAVLSGIASGHVLYVYKLARPESEIMNATPGRPLNPEPSNRPSTVAVLSGIAEELGISQDDFNGPFSSSLLLSSLEFSNTQVYEP